MVTIEPMAFLVPAYNVRAEDIVGRGRIKHEEFIMASGEPSRAVLKPSCRRLRLVYTPAVHSHQSQRENGAECEWRGAG